ncbi:uncharacterized protein BT62DRAFT_935366 [Guyanagaster necrorhizus]|uniref:Transcription factor CBF/NF-Y/archaeal histone domain-containing protein n=1 Tax=Guyanagaster necrorhizus TaxID=856835 RepID=A0A9P8AQN5_9AGAR|nr:uncharacterized protein BT62DRAFT_935366 [Guyanagaster necrorhizus MCA 3950]KAG7443047.1 hypothetical protein BT62DRAFT_935366 [Guyanagaster necrorhizus MCA 3950]
MASHHPPIPLLPAELILVDSDVEAEVDQLDSDTEGLDEPDVNGASASANDTMSGARSSRPVGQTLLPGTKLENIISADGVTGSLSLSKEALFVLSIATEEFIKRLAQGGLRQANSERRSAVQYQDMAATTLQYQEFRFLQDTIPTAISLADAIFLREEMEKQLFDEEPPPLKPSTSTVNYTYPVIPPLPSTTSQPLNVSSKPKGKSRMANGREKSNGSSSWANGSSSHNESTFNEIPNFLLDARPWWHYWPKKPAEVQNGLGETRPSIPHDPTGAGTSPLPTCPRVDGANASRPGTPSVTESRRRSASPRPSQSQTPLSEEISPEPRQNISEIRGTTADS